MKIKPGDVRIPAEILIEFQDIVNVLAKIIVVPAALILTYHSANTEVLCASETTGNPYKTGEIIPGEDRVCRETAAAKDMFLIADGTKVKNWQDSFPAKKGMVSFLGSVMLWPNDDIFGIICVLDSKENQYHTLHKKLLSRFKKEVETLLWLLCSQAESKKNKIDLKGAEDKLESVGILAGGIAQDFNSLLSVIIGNISLTRMEIPPGEKAYDLLLEAEKASCQAADIAGKLIIFSEGGWLVRREESLSSLLKESIDASSLKSKISFTLIIPPAFPPVFVDEGQFNQVLQNIFLNAAEAMPGGGVVRISARTFKVENDEFPPLQPGEYVRLLIEDQGTGIPQEHLDKIFDPYFSTKNSLTQRGMGLGLSICYSIIKKHEGWITVESEAGAGTTVYLYVPVFNENIEKESINF